ncbi:hypothetical protein [Flavobacterium proteolyticum]|uniref:Uncharacterized protein n=1 Tax=Flavobacterium proteolyticum TaxID=2911683 RepID=A0ABR9WN87_9FLAO|nr:hypothetical protein [Flavobacterium proteolyticum]MBE9575373.1 hypothetical protein [Flavobacterium proteolyticum]
MQSSLNSRTSKLVTDTIFNFSIDTDFCYSIYNPTTKVTSYTFATISENPKLQNLVVACDSLQVFKTYLMDYDINKNDFTTINPSQIPNIEANCKLINFDATSLFNKCQASMELICVETWGYAEGGTESPMEGELVGYYNGDNVSGSVWVLQSTSCSFVYNDGCTGGGDLGTGFITTPTDGSGGGGSSLVDNDSPCNKLKNLFKYPQPNIKSTIINDLRPNIDVNPKGEKGAALIKTNTGVMNTRVLPATTDTEIFMPTGGSYYSAIHTHPKFAAYPMFSYSDVVFLQKMHNNIESYNEDLASFLLVCQDDSGTFQTYAIVFDPFSLNDGIDQFLNTPENNGCSQNEIKGQVDELLKEEFNIDNNYERVFLKFMAHTNVSIYKANSTLTNWNKLSMDTGITNTVKSTPCN